MMMADDDDKELNPDAVDDLLEVDEAADEEEETDDIDPTGLDAFGAPIDE